MLENTIVSLLETWKNNFTNPKNKALDVMTNSSVIAIDILQNFINQAKAGSPKINGVRIYFIRYDEPHENIHSDPPDHVKEIGNSGFSQVSLAFVPVIDFDKNTLAGTDFKLPGDQILTLAFCHPQKDKAGTASGTGHCPPKCPG